MQSKASGKYDHLSADQRLLVGTLKEREAEAKRQGVFECWETKARRDQEMRGRSAKRNLTP